MKMLDIIVVLLVASFHWECATQQSDSLAHINDKKARSILLRALDKAGGFSRWQAIDKLEFEKTTSLFEQDGTIESTVYQQHRYFYSPAQVIDIQWQDSLGYHQILKKGNTVTKYLNNIIEPANEAELLNTVLSSEYVVMLPFKLANENIELTYEGLDTLEDQLEVHTIRAHYNPQNPDIFDTTDIWWHYFDRKNLRHSGYKVEHADHTSLVRNNTYIFQNGLIFPENRSSFRIDVQGKIDHLRAEYTYSNYLVNQ